MKFRVAVFLFAFLPFALPAIAAAAPYYVPPGQFNVTVKITKSGTPISATFGKATGEFHFDKETAILSDLRVAIDARSVNSSVSDDKDAFFDLLDVPMHPEITYAAPDQVTFKDGKGSIKGMLTLNGKSQPVTLDATAEDGDAMSRTFNISFHATIKRADFGIDDDPKTPRLYGDTITLQFDMQAIRQ